MSLFVELPAIFSCYTKWAASNFLRNFASLTDSLSGVLNHEIQEKLHRYSPPYERCTDYIDVRSYVPGEVHKPYRLIQNHVKHLR